LVFRIVSADCYARSGNQSFAKGVLVMKLSWTAVVEDITLNAKLLSTLGIILNELITNSMKYAFIGRGGIITVKVTRDESHVSIQYQDNGTGLPDSFDFENTTGFGMQLVKMLVEQIRGSIRIERGKGAKFIIMFDPCYYVSV
jgi:two-component sensor histidine kinase